MKGLLDLSREIMCLLVRLRVLRLDKVMVLMLLMLLVESIVVRLEVNVEVCLEVGDGRRR